MLNVLLPSVTVGAIAWAARAALLPRERRTGLRSSAAAQEPTVPPADLLALLRKYGTNSNAFMTLYPGFSHFRSPAGVTAYIDRPRAWVGGAQPLAEPVRMREALEDYARAAEREGKAALLFPVDREFAELARAAGYYALQVGSEPMWDLERFPPTGNTWLDVVPTAKQMYAKGARVRELKPREIPAADRAELDTITADWLDSRKTVALGFLNQVRPWLYAEEKKYFAVEHEGRVLAFLAAIPIPARNSWYLVDLLRREGTPPGTTELLLLQTMKLLREQGARAASTGVAPLSGLEGRRSESFLYGLLAAMYEHANWLYNFKPLHQYKLKLQPTSSEPVFLIYRPRIGLGETLSVFGAFFPAGIARVGWETFLRAVRGLDLPGWLQKQLSPDTVVRSAPRTLPRLLRRCKATAALLVLNLATYIVTTDAHGKLAPAIEARWGFSWPGFTVHPFQALALSPFLHWNLAHVISNLLSLALFTGMLEYYAGTAIALSCYAVAMWVSNPLTYWVMHSLLARMSGGELDVGASLGIFGTAGALAPIFRRGWAFLAILSLCVGADIYITGLPAHFNHLFALGIGYLAGRIAIKS